MKIKLRGTNTFFGPAERQRLFENGLGVRKIVRCSSGSLDDSEKFLRIGNSIHFSRTIDIYKESDKRWLVHEIACTLQFNYRGLIYIP